MKSLLSLFRSSIAEDQGAMLDHVPVKGEPTDWRDEAVAKAAIKLGKPFQCGPISSRREVMVAPGVFAVANAREAAAVAEAGAPPVRIGPAAPVSIFNKRERT